MYNKLTHKLRGDFLAGEAQNCLPGSKPLLRRERSLPGLLWPGFSPISPGEHCTKKKKTQTHTKFIFNGLVAPIKEKFEASPVTLTSLPQSQKNPVELLSQNHPITYPPLCMGLTPPPRNETYTQDSQIFTKWLEPACPTPITIRMR